MPSIVEAVCILTYRKLKSNSAKITNLKACQTRFGVRYTVKNAKHSPVFIRFRISTHFYDRYILETKIDIRL